MTRPQPTEAASYYFTYINQVTSDDPVSAIEHQLEESQALFAKISEEKSLHRYAPDKWSIRQVLNHVTDTERAFAFRALWFARGFDTPLPSYDQNIAATGAEADRTSWAAHVDEFRSVRLSTISKICHRKHGREAESPAAIPSPCQPWPTSFRDTSPTTSRCCASDTCKELFS